MLKHYVLFTFEKDFLNEEVMAEYRAAFSHIADTYEQVLSAKIYRNCIDRPANMELMIEMELTDASALSVYLNDPEHVRMGQKYNPHVIHRVSFDHEI